MVFPGGTQVQEGLVPGATARGPLGAWQPWGGRAKQDSGAGGLRARAGCGLGGGTPSLERALGLWGHLGGGLQLLCRPAGATDVCEPDGMGLSASGIWTRDCTSEGERLVH